MRHHPEHGEQAAVVAWARLHETRWPVLRTLFAVPNGASLAGGPSARARQMARLKAEGLKIGVPDLWLVAGIGEKHGLVIEMKAGRNKPTTEQKWWLQTLEALRWQTAVCYSADDAIATIKAYIGLPA